MNNYDAIIIGFGKGGKTLAIDLASRNWKVAVVERSAGMYGGTCINIGCIPTKSLAYQAKITDFKQKSNNYSSPLGQQRSQINSGAIRIFCQDKVK